MIHFDSMFFQSLKRDAVYFPSLPKTTFKSCYGTVCTLLGDCEILKERGCNLVPHNVDTQCRNAVTTLAVSPKQQDGNSEN